MNLEGSIIHCNAVLGPYGQPLLLFWHGFFVLNDIPFHNLNPHLICYSPTSANSPFFRVYHVSALMVSPSTFAIFAPFRLQVESLFFVHSAITRCAPITPLAFDLSPQAIATALELPASDDPLYPVAVLAPPVPVAELAPPLPVAVLAPHTPVAVLTPW